MQGTICEYGSSFVRGPNGLLDSVSPLFVTQTNLKLLPRWGLIASHCQANHRAPTAVAPYARSESLGHLRQREHDWASDLGGGPQQSPGDKAMGGGKAGEVVMKGVLQFSAKEMGGEHCLEGACAVAFRGKSPFFP